MACPVLLELDEDCLNNMGGTTQFLYTDQTDVDATATVINPTTDIITTMSSAVVPKAVAFKKNACSYTEDEKIDLEAGSNYVEGTVNLSLKRREAAKSKMIRNAGAGQRKLAIWIKDGNGLWWYFQNMQLSANTGGSGENKAAGSKYDLAFMGEYEGIAHQVDETVIASLLTP